MNLPPDKGEKTHNFRDNDQESTSINVSLHENSRSVGQNRQISEMSGEFGQFAGQYVR